MAGVWVGADSRALRQRESSLGGTVMTRQGAGIKQPGMNQGKVQRLQDSYRDTALTEGVRSLQEHKGLYCADEVWEEPGSTWPARWFAGRSAMWSH